VNEEAGYLYVNIAKAGCTSVKTAIARQAGVAFNDVQWGRPWHQPITFARLRDDLFRFSIVRHPAARLVSCWSDWCCEPYPPKDNLERNHDLARLGGCSFAAFLDYAFSLPWERHNPHFGPQWPRLHVAGRLVVDEIVKLENIERQWPSIQNRTGLGALPHIRSSEHEDWPMYFTTSQLRDVREMFAMDFENLEYAL